ncbi:hypothetical protein [Halobacillus amylolyticus]|uniref:Cytochrome c assembly protein domain-containing protein n=1 Tax=Halobacillus amylolyticus TaxID=2932259 RepID=A0ABY4HAX0_9BACI|nr:hypothetical protein [Halobacillus amylolyticus]UOR10550.1 hypothetical protein MUO15_12785 [Halobacillus amylolyticus]
MIQMVVGSAVTLSAINIAFMGRHFWSVNVIVLLTAVWNFLNLVVVGSMPQAQAISFSLYLVTVIILCLIFVIRNSYYSSNLSETKPKERNIQKVSYVVNIIFFVLICAGALFFTWGLMFAGGFQWKLLLPLSSIVAWLIFYKFQMKLIVKRPVASVLVGLVFLVLALIAPFAIAIFLT